MQSNGEYAIRAAERETRGPKTASGIRLPANRGFMDDLTISTESHIQARWILQSLEDTVWNSSPTSPDAWSSGKDKSQAWRTTTTSTDFVNRLRMECRQLARHNYQAWMYQHGLLPRFIWPLTLYDIPTTAVEVLERTVSKHLRRWLGVPPSFTNIGLYGNTTKLQLPLSSVLEEFKVSKTRLVVTLRDSRDQYVTPE